MWERTQAEGLEEFIWKRVSAKHAWVDAPAQSAAKVVAEAS